MQVCRVPSSMWSKIGRLKRSEMPKLRKGRTIFGSGASPGIMSCIAGRLLCDTFLCSRDLLREVYHLVGLLHPECTYYLFYSISFASCLLTGQLFFDTTCKNSVEQRPEGGWPTWCSENVPNVGISYGTCKFWCLLWTVLPIMFDIEIRNCSLNIKELF